jgi:tripartite-type tricarboxylate transporter receptor subunit TctC
LRSVVRFIAIATLMLGMGAHAQNYPARTVRLITPFAPGSGTDLPTRAFAQYLESSLGRPVVVENKPGAGGLIAAQYVAAAEPDGHTLLYTGATISIMRVLLKKSVDPLVELAPVSIVTNGHSVFVANSSIPARNLREFVAYAKTRPGALNYASAGKNSTFLLVERLKELAGIELVEIPFSGQAQYAIALGRNDVQFALGSISGLKPLQDAGKARILAVIGDERSPHLPDIATTAEQGFPGIRSVAWTGILAPAGTARSVIDRLVLESRQYVAKPEVVQSLRQIYYYGVGSTSEEFRQLLAREIDAWTDIARRTGITPE